MKYRSTRGDPAFHSFSDILLEGLAPDGGLYLPVAYPQLSDAQLSRWRDLPYADLAFEVLSLFIDDIPPHDLQRLCRATYTEATFGTPEIAPVEPLGAREDGLFVQALSNGPTLAFKDMAMQLLGALFEYELARRGEHLNVLGATSGDTGSAAEYALRGKRGVQVFMLSPHGRMSPFQQAQMFSLQDPNIHNIAIEGTFDDCQDIVKAVGNDLAFKQRHRIGSVNSINWARLAAQVVYYVSGWLQTTRQNGERVRFAVPTGNFGNLCAGHVARSMGLPIDRLVLASNENDVLDRFFKTGVYRVQSRAEETSSPSMDIGKASNVERFVYDLLGRDAARVRSLFGSDVPAHGGFALGAAEHAGVARFGIVSGRSTHVERLDAIRVTLRHHGRLIDPHTADALNVALQHRVAGVPMIVLETALPAKFAATIVEATGEPPALPAALRGLEALPRRCSVLPADTAAVQRFIEAHAGESAARTLAGSRLHP